MSRRTAAANRAPQYEFSTAWFQTETQPLWERYLLPRRPFSSYCEIGVWEGASLLWAFDHLLSSEGIATGIDPFEPKRKKDAAHTAQVRERCLRNVGPAQATGRLKLIERRSQDVLLEWCAHAAGSTLFDLIFVDGQHEAVPCLEDLTFGWRLLHVGGILVCDDLSYRWTRRRPRVWEAVTAFEWAYERRFERLYRTHEQVAYVKVQ